MKRAQFLFVSALIVLDIGCTWLAFFLSHQILDRDPDVAIGAFSEFWPLPFVYSIVLVGLFFVQRMYQRRRSASHLDEAYRIVLYTYLRCRSHVY